VRHRRRRSRCSSIPARGKANSSRRMIVTPATAGPWTRRASTRRIRPVHQNPRRSINAPITKGRWAPASTDAGIRSNRETPSQPRRAATRRPSGSPASYDFPKCTGASKHMLEPFLHKRTRHEAEITRIR